MEVKLKVLVGANVGQEIRITGPKFFVGRAEDCQLRPRSDLISRHHCVLIVEEKVVAIRDFGSKNGTYVNAERVNAERTLNDGDSLKIGPLEFTVSIRDVAKKRPPVTSIDEAVKRTACTEFDMDVDVSSWIAAPQPDVNDSETRELRRRDTEQVSLPSAETSVVPKGEIPPKTAAPTASPRTSSPNISSPSLSVPAVPAAKAPASQPVIAPRPSTAPPVPTAPAGASARQETVEISLEEILGKVISDSKPVITPPAAPAPTPSQATIAPPSQFVQDPEPENAEAEDEESKKAGDKKSPGKLPSMKTVDSHSAAADMLKKFRRR